MRTGEAATAVRSATTMLRNRSAAGPNNHQRDHHRNRSETLHADILRPFGRLRTGERAQANSPSGRDRKGADSSGMNVSRRLGRLDDKFTATGILCAAPERTGCTGWIGDFKKRRLLL